MFLCLFEYSLHRKGVVINLKSNKCFNLGTIANIIIGKRALLEWQLSLENSARLHLVFTSLI
jgi:hypothetical protein